MTDLIPLFVFALVMYITPGPNNVMVASSSANYGIRATLPHMVGIAVGFALMLDLVCAGIAGLLIAIPALTLTMRVLGAMWMAWLAYKIATAKPPEPGEQRGRLMGFFGAAAFQWINPKAWMIALAVATTFLRPDEPLSLELLRLTLVFLICSVPSLYAWALIGSGARRLLRSHRAFRIFNVSMGGLLLASVIPMVLEE